MRYTVALAPRAVRELERLPLRIRKRIATAIDGLADAPMPVGAKKLQGPDGFWRIRVGDYRVIYDVRHKSVLVLVIRIGHRRDVYR